jgi:hypothetical protein
MVFSKSNATCEEADIGEGEEEGVKSKDILSWRPFTPSRLLSRSATESEWQL